MDDIMAGFRGPTKEKSSQQQVAVAVNPLAQPRPAVKTTLHTSPAVLPKLQRSTPVVADRQPGPQSTLPRHLGTGSEVVAQLGSVILSSNAPSTVPATGKVNGPPVGNPIQVELPFEAAPPGTTLESSDAAMDGVEPGRMVKGSRRVA
ncbi:hypothetical protein M407DRAFT_133497 [Tulasnella calospora MUT 4182]|uniref:Uncharacterized protein n=1 Tax=Tulasnella calospora MUT 4182 TaxID=1051891 RepID=A0A0C3QRP7_9AGAM|nr:hypothetical protein M407DRAFT_133497 [Tulasnella calospora MUT 4182]